MRGTSDAVFHDSDNADIIRQSEPNLTTGRSTMAKKKGGSLSQAAAALGKRGGKFGGPARAKVLTAGERSEIAREGANAANKKKARS